MTELQLLTCVIAVAAVFLAGVIGYRQGGAF